jgi:hypothetical protein
MFFIPFDSSDILSLTEQVVKKSNWGLIFDYSGLGGSRFPCERTTAQGAAAAHQYPRVHLNHGLSYLFISGY